MANKLDTQALVSSRKWLLWSKFNVFGSDIRMKKMNDFWTIRVEDAELQWHIFAIQSKGDCFLSANTKLVGFDKAVQLSSEELARSFCEAVLPTLRRRHGEAVLAMVATCRTTGSRIDDSLVRARIEEGLFAPNKLPARLSTDRTGVGLPSNDQAMNQLGKNRKILLNKRA